MIPSLWCITAQMFNVTWNSCTVCFLIKYRSIILLCYTYSSSFTADGSTCNIITFYKEKKNPECLIFKLLNSV